jgi:simple sugar transport system ATP-binding protein/ribose transport system ATP-binding protein
MSRTVELLTLTGVSKHFGGVRALDDVDLVVERGSVHALVGENGAGKSTLGKIIAGILGPDGGAMRLRGNPVRYHGAHDALGDGITMIAQELPLVPSMSALDNVFLGAEDSFHGVVRKDLMRRRFDELRERTGFEIPASQRVDRMRIADQQKVAIMCALARDAELIVMDEPTAALGRDDAIALLEVVRDLSKAGAAVVYVSHFLEEVLQVADTVTVMKDGRVVRSGPAAEETPDTLMTGMLGRSLGMQFPEPARPAADAPVTLEVRDLGRRGSFENVSLTLRAGEILGLAGLVGSGRSEVARAIAGVDRFDTGEVLLHGETLRAHDPAAAIRAGVALIPDSRRDLGLVMNNSVVFNVSLPHLGPLSAGGFMRRRRERRIVESARTRAGVNAGLSRRVETLSGGNQQKTLFARWMAAPPRVLLADEPTRGIDVGSKRGVYDLVTDLAREGLSVMLISNENEELLGLAHRILVMRSGRVVAEMDGASASENDLVRAAFGASA